jgi:AraC-like DNA-binding protein
MLMFCGMKSLPIMYLSTGLRRYGEHPVRPNQRDSWELQCVIRGGARPWPDSGGPPIAGARLYLFGPEDQHGWSASGRDISEVLVFHVSPAAKGWTDRGSFQQSECLALSDLEVLRLRTLHDWLLPHFLHPREPSFDVLESGAVLLADLVEDLHRPERGAEGGQTSRSAQEKVQEACRCYREKMLTHPTVEQIAGVVGLSASQLRRVFGAAGHPPPGTVFRSMQMDYAHRLLVGTGLPVEHIAEELGFSSLSTFSRAFASHGGQSPREARRGEARVTPGGGITGCQIG